nr:unnamed protein product [Latilactobacillus sakei]SOE45419.1 unnamed protein product [Latilactobacillus sakei]
MSEQRSD